MLSMSDKAWYIFIRTLQLSCMMLLCSVFLLISHDNSGGRHIYLTAMALYENPQALLFIGLILSACMEDVYSKR